LKLVYVQWLDAINDDGDWVSKKHVEKLPPVKCETVGWVIDEDDSYITLVQTISEEQMAGRFTILKGMITNRKEL